MVTYDYFIHLNKDPIHFRYSSCYVGLILDYDLVREAAALILKTRDFKALCKQPNSYNNPLCDISNCEIFFNEEQGRFRFTITANRFLRGMLRICVLFLMEVGRGNMTLHEFEEILSQKKRFGREGTCVSEWSFS
jgi:tRNA pseudouridine38-40 synthase